MKARSVLEAEYIWGWLKDPQMEHEQCELECILSNLHKLTIQQLSNALRLEKTPWRLPNVKVDHSPAFKCTSF